MFPVFYTEAHPEASAYSIYSTEGLSPRSPASTAVPPVFGNPGLLPPADEYFQKRVDTVRKAIRAAGAGKEAALPAAFIENSSHCLTNDDDEKVIGPNRDKRWLPDLMTEVIMSSCTAVNSVMLGQAYLL